jgi:hypothetical protein
MFMENGDSMLLLMVLKSKLVTDIRTHTLGVVFKRRKMEETVKAAV